jgi:hypothetical protein
MLNCYSNEVIRTFDTAFPESIAIERITEEGEHTNVTAFCREYSLVTELIELHRDGKVKSFEVK